MLFGLRVRVINEDGSPYTGNDIIVTKLRQAEEVNLNYQVLFGSLNNPCDDVAVIYDTECYP